LARAITAADNPLTARVIVNRVWMHHFGEPLVATPNDFGLRSRPPTHPELLDWLAAELVDGGWSLKRLHRLIVTSHTYRQVSIADCGLRVADSASNPQPAIRSPQSIDPENRLLWRANRRRLDLEAMRDTLLAAGGRLDSLMFGRPTNMAGDPANRRPTIYGLVERQSLPRIFRTFDFASPRLSPEEGP